jgi:hypothetical protein
VQPLDKFGIFLLHLQLGACGFGVGKRIDDFGFCTGELAGALEVF